MNIYIKHPTNPLIAFDLSVQGSLLQMTVDSLLKEIGRMMPFDRIGGKNIDISNFWRLRNEITNEYMDADLPISKLNTNDKFTSAFGGEITNDLDQINTYADQLNQEAEDVLGYQVIK